LGLTKTPPTIFYGTVNFQIMKKLTNKLLLAAALLLGVASASAQSVKLESGALDFLKGETALNLEYNYDGLTVGKLAEQAYVDEKVAAANAKEAGKGDAWLVSWKADRERRYQPKFEELFNKQFFDKQIDFHVGQAPKAKFTMVLKTTNLEPGFNVAVMRRPAAVSTEATFYETADRSKPLAVVTVSKAPGQDAMGYDYDTGQRLSEGYAKTGKELGKFLIKKALK
jgi:hypothetical protein